MEQTEAVFQSIVRYGVLALEAIGSILILFFSIRSVICLVKKDLKGSRYQMTLGITTGLSFMLGSEVLNTIIAPGLNDIGMTCAILIMRAGITLLVHWENKHEEMYHFTGQESESGSAEKAEKKDKEE